MEKYATLQIPSLLTIMALLPPIPVTKVSFCLALQHKLVVLQMALVDSGVMKHLLVNVSNFSVSNEIALDKECIDLFLATCPPLSFITDGSISYSRAVEANGGYLSDTVATFSCNDGYELSEDTTKTCQDNHMWTGADPFCQSKDEYFIQYKLSITCVLIQKLNARILLNSLCTFL